MDGSAAWNGVCMNACIQVSHNVNSRCILCIPCTSGQGTTPHQTAPHCSTLSYTRTHTHAHTHTRARVHTHTHTHTHTHQTSKDVTGYVCVCVHMLLCSYVLFCSQLSLLQLPSPAWTPLCACPHLKVLELKQVVCMLRSHICEFF